MKLKHGQKWQLIKCSRPYRWLNQIYRLVSIQGNLICFVGQKSGAFLYIDSYYFSGTNTIVVHRERFGDVVTFRLITSKVLW